MKRYREAEIMMIKGKSEAYREAWIIMIEVNSEVTQGSPDHNDHWKP